MSYFENRPRVRFAGASGLVLATCLSVAPATSWAQSTPTGTQGPGIAQGEVEEPAEATQNAEIIVTGSRVARSGFTAPTPTTVIGAETIGDRGQTNATD